MDTLNLQSPFGHHIGRHRRINAAGKQTHSSAAHTGGQAPSAGLSRAVDVGRKIPHLHIHGVLRMVHIHLHRLALFTGYKRKHLRIFCQLRAFNPGGLRRITSGNG